MSTPFGCLTVAVCMPREKSLARCTRSWPWIRTPREQFPFVAVRTGPRLPHWVVSLPLFQLVLMELLTLYGNPEDDNLRWLKKGHPFEMPMILDRGRAIKWPVRRLTEKTQQLWNALGIALQSRISLGSTATNAIS